MVDLAENLVKIRLTTDDGPFACDNACTPKGFGRNQRRRQVTVTEVFRDRARYGLCDVVGNGNHNGSPCVAEVMHSSIGIERARFACDAARATDLARAFSCSLGGTMPIIFL